MKKIGQMILFAIFAFGLVFSVNAQKSSSQYSIWAGTHYTGYDGYIQKVAEFENGEEGFSPELKFNYLYSKENNAIGIQASYYDADRMNLKLNAELGELFKANIGYKSFYRQLQRDQMDNLQVREWLGTKPGGKMITHELLNPDQELGYNRREITSNFELKIPGMTNIKLVAAHKSIMEKGHEEVQTLSHCGTCHIQSDAIELKRISHTVIGGVEAKFDKFFVSYKANYRMFQSDAGSFTAKYDSAGHPSLPLGTGGYGTEFGSRLLTSNTYAPIAEYPETEKLSHQLTAKAAFGKTKLMVQYVMFGIENNGNLESPGSSVSGTPEYSGNYFKGKIVTPLMPKLKMIADAYYGSFENNELAIDLRDYRENRPAGDIDMDWTRYSILTRNEFSTKVKLIYQPKSAWRIGLAGGYETRERLDYPLEDAGDETTKIFGELNLRNRFISKITTNFTYRLTSTDNPFAPHNRMFERFGAYGKYALSPLNGDSKVYYYQREENDFRYGSITNQPSLSHNLRMKMNWRVSDNLKIMPSFSMQLGSNDFDEFEFTQSFMSPSLGLNYAADNFMLFANYTMMQQSQTGVAAVAMMDG
jgi:hypothetical protein